MNLRTSLLCLCFAAIGILQAQPGSDAAVKKNDNAMLAKYKAKGTYPLIKASKFSGVLPVDGINEKPDATVKYKLLFNLETGSSDPQKAKETNRGLAEIGRIINLHIAAGIPLENLEVVIVARHKALFAMLNNEAFKKEFKVDNPNLEIISELQSAGAKFIACGQTMQFLEIANQRLSPQVKIALSANVAFSSYQQMGFVKFDIEEE